MARAKPATPWPARRRLDTDAARRPCRGALWLSRRGPWAPERGLWFDPAKLLVDPHAVELDRRFAYDPALSTFGVDGAAGARAIVPGPLPLVPPAPPVFAPGG
jgi:hypothetical protein